MVHLSYGTQIVTQCVAMLIFNAHWFACVIALQASLHNDARNTIAGAYGFCTDESWSLYQEGERGSSLPSCPGLSVGEWYLATVSWSIMVITGTGGTDVHAQDLNPPRIVSPSALINRA